MAATASTSDWDDIVDYTQEELDEILQEVDKFEREELAESDVELGGESDSEIGDNSDPEDDVPLATLQTTWRPPTQPTKVRDFVLPTGPNHALPDTAKPLD